MRESCKSQQTSITAGRWFSRAATEYGYVLVSRQLTGDDRPKQFCRLWGGRTLLSQTRRRLEPVVPIERTLLVLTREHRPFYEPELAAEPAAWTIVQPSNRGTAAAILWSLLRIAELDWDAAAAFFPADHYYAHEKRFRKSVARPLQPPSTTASRWWCWAPNPIAPNPATAGSSWNAGPVFPLGRFAGFGRSPTALSPNNSSAKAAYGVPLSWWVRWAPFWR